MLHVLLLALAPQATATAAAPATQPPTEPVATPNVTLVQLPEVFERLSFDANGRVRAESTFDQPNANDRHRGRMRFRVGAHYEVTDEVTAHARLSTISDGKDANNPHWDFGDGNDAFTGGDLVFDRFYLDWKATKGLDLRAGKFGHAFTAPGVMGEYVWDGDIQPSGVAAVWAPPASDGSKGPFDLRAIYYVAVENGDDADSAVGGLQGNLYFDTSDDSQLQFAAGYYDWSSLGAGASALGNQGNTDVTGDFEILDTFAAWTLQGGLLGKTTLTGEYMYNFGDDDDEDTGYALAARFGPSGKDGDFNVFASWYDLDANAVFSPVSQDDTPIAGTGLGDGMSGVIAGGQYYIADNLSVKLWGLTSDADASDDPYRIRLDFDFSVK